MLFLSCGFIPPDNFIPFRVLAWEGSLKAKPLKAKSLEFKQSKGHIWVTEGVNLIQRAQWETWAHQMDSFIIHALGWPLSELKWSPWTWPEIYLNRAIVSLKSFKLFFREIVSFPRGYRASAISKWLPDGTWEESALAAWLIRLT